jgi:hypothetical protein
MMMYVLLINLALQFSNQSFYSYGCPLNLCVDLGIQKLSFWVDG